VPELLVVDHPLIADAVRQLRDEKTPNADFLRLAGDISRYLTYAAFRRAGRRRDYGSTVMVTTLSPCWYCSGLVRQFNIGAVVIGEAATFHGGHDWLEELGVEIIVLDDEECTTLLGDFIHEHPEIWHEDIGL